MELLWCSRNKAEFTRASACLQQNPLVNGAPNGFVTHPATPSCLHDRDIFHTHILLPSWTLSRQKEMMTSFDCCVAAIKRGQSVASGPSSDSPKSASNCSILFTVHWCRSTSRSHP